MQPMGLDMYMARKFYVKNWDHQKPEEKHTFLIKKGGKKRTDIDPNRISYITEEVGYWRKANAIHKWFVDNVQEGNDDCKEYFVSREKLKELLDLCERVSAASELVEGEIANGYTFEGTKKVPIMQKGKYIKDPSVAKELLPSQEGFFFGSTDYNEYYLHDIEHTIKILKEAVAAPEIFGGPDYYYHASW